jgi:translation initiation factor 1 (eIF-1/SUI1)
MDYFRDLKKNLFILLMSFDLINNESANIEIWIEERGRKADTYVYGWDLDEESLKNHLKIIKKKRGCNGSIKEIVKENGPIKVMQLQGNIKDYVVSYLIENGVNEDNIKIKI